jgi:ubiquinone/menaquinone biosynthesis C-methylase UbiE
MEREINGRLDIDRHRYLGEVGEHVERIAPPYCSNSLTEQHVARYRWASRFVRDRLTLDLACGTGYGAEILLSGGSSSVVSSDISHDAMQLGKELFEISAVQANGLSLPFRDAAFGAIVSLETIEHVTDGRQLLTEFDRVLKPSGRLLLSTPNARLSPGGNPYHLKEFMLDEVFTLCRSLALELVGTWGQHWRLRPEFARKVKGFRRLSFELEKSWAIRRWPAPFAEPLYWCIAAEKP